MIQDATWDYQQFGDVQRLNPSNGIKERMLEKGGGMEKGTLDSSGERGTYQICHSSHTFLCNGGYYLSQVLLQDSRLSSGKILVEQPR